MTRNDNEKTIAHNTVRIHYCSGSLLQRYTLILSLAVSNYVGENTENKAHGTQLKAECKETTMKNANLNTHFTVASSKTNIVIYR